MEAPKRKPDASIGLRRFRTAVHDELELSPNPTQREVVVAPPGRSLFLVAGPGSGKTTAIALRVLKLFFVDRVAPERIMATTFTRKAAQELRSRILKWGDELGTCFGMPDAAARLNGIVSGTLDSICQDKLSESRSSEGAAQVIVEEFIQRGMLLREGLFQNWRFHDDGLHTYLKRLNGSRGLKRLNAAEVTDTLIDLYHRLHNDRADRAKFEKELLPRDPGISVALKAIDDYVSALERNLQVDYVQLAAKFLERLKSGDLDDFRNGIRHVFVDEYQDTNLLQESIYFEIAGRSPQSGGSMTVVGDDDQSLYRFRGATVNLFTQFPKRFEDRFGTAPETVFLANNFRSTQAIVDFCNDFVGLDANYGTQRVPGKPPVTKARTGKVVEWPVLGLFRQDRETLARDLARFIREVALGEGVDIPTSDGGVERMQVSADGSAADCVLLCASPREYDVNRKPRLPKLLEDELGGHPGVFNPRGQALASIDSVGRLCGLMLECIDPKGKVQNDIPRLPSDAKNSLSRWRRLAKEASGKEPALRDFVTAWPEQKRRYVHLNELCYKLVYWIPEMHTDAEGLVYLEAVARVINDAGVSGLSRFRSQIARDASDPGLEAAAVRDLIWNTFVPLATGAVDLNEDLLQSPPADRIPVMSIHQAKGLEFPLVVVDVGSDFNMPHWTQAFKRFPRREEEGGRTCRLEDEVRPYTQLGRDERPGVDRAFDDLVRQFFVSYSRAQDVLLLVGTDAVKNGEVHNVAVGWDRDKQRHWEAGLPGLHHI